jgi:hypothetical protein
MILAIREGGTNSQSMQYLTKSQSYLGLKHLLSDTEVMTTCSFTIELKELVLLYIVCRVLKENGNTLLSLRANLA